MRDSVRNGWGNGFQMREVLLVVLVGALAGLSPARGQSHPLSARQLERQCEVEVLSSSTIEQAIRAEAQRGYDIAATPNQGRFTAGMLFALAERQRNRGSDDTPFLIRHEELFPAFLRVTGLPPSEVPPTYRKANEVGLVMIVEYRTSRVIEQVEDGPVPRQALAVRATWPAPDDRPPSYTYADTTSDPDVRVRRQRNTTYRLLEYADLVVYDETEGIAAQPTSGALGALFDAIGMVEIEETRFVVADDGTQGTRTQVDLLVPLETLATVTPEGRAHRGLAEDHPQLQRLKEVLNRDLEITYAGPPPSACPAAPDWTRRAEK